MLTINFRNVEEEDVFISIIKLLNIEMVGVYSIESGTVNKNIIRNIRDLHGLTLGIEKNINIIEPIVVLLGINHDNDKKLH